MTGRERWIGWRNRLLADPAFQRFAARFPLTRPFARWRARAIFDLVAGFTYSQTLAACIQTGLLQHLHPEPLTTDAIARQINLPADGADRLLRAARALKLVEQLRDRRWALGADGAALIGNGGIAEMVAHHHLLYADLADPVGLLRRGGGGGQLSDYWRYAERSGQGSSDDVSPYSRLMAASQPLIAEHVIGAYRFSDHRRMLDVGGGEGAFIAAVARAVPGLKFGLFDLPAVGDRARAALNAAGQGDRVTIHGGNFMADALPAGHDLITLIRVLHDHDDGPAQNLLRSIFESLEPGGKLLIAEPMAETPGAEPAGDAYFGLYLLAMGSGRPRSMAEISGMLRLAGFNQIRPLRTPMPLTVRAVVATR
ncbi:MAG: methyltransferase domain-containing protein [Sphingomonas sp.]|nr:methyltransferase domain-containing protein [Sphingomonas sp.]